TRERGHASRAAAGGGRSPPTGDRPAPSATRAPAAAAVRPRPGPGPATLAGRRDSGGCTRAVRRGGPASVRGPGRAVRAPPGRAARDPAVAFAARPPVGRSRGGTSPVRRGVVRL